MYFSGRRKDCDYGGGADDLHDGSDARDNDDKDDDNAMHHPLPHGLGLWLPFGCFLQFFLVVCVCGCGCSVHDTKACRPV